MVTTYYCEFSNKGFFGFGEEGNFRYWSLAHFIPILLMIGAIVLIYLYRDRLHAWKHEGHVRTVLAFALIICEMSYFWRLLFVGSSEPTEVLNLLDKLPIQVCGWTCIFASFMLSRKSNVLYQICFFVCLTAGIFPLLTPAVITSTGPAYYRYYQFFLEHTLPIIAVFYMTFVHKYRPTFKGILYAVGFLAVLATVAIIVNLNVEGANYMYLAEATDGDSIVNLMPENVWVRLGLFALVVFPLFLLVYYLSRWIEKLAEKRKLKKQSA